MDVWQVSVSIKQQLKENQRPRLIDVLYQNFRMFMYFNCSESSQKDLLLQVNVFAHCAALWQLHNNDWKVSSFFSCNK